MKKKILIVVPSLRLGGQERVSVNDAEILKNDYDVTMLLFDGSERAYEAPVPVIEAGLPARSGKLNKAVNVFKRVKVVNEAIKANGYDVIFSFGDTANLVNLLSRRAKKKIVSLRAFKSVNMKWYEAMLYSRASAIVCVSEAMKNKLATLQPRLGKLLVTVTNPYDIEQILEKGKEPVSDYGFIGTVIVCHARLSEVKNLPRLIKAVSLLTEEIPDIRLLIIGEGEERERLEGLIRKYGLEDRVSLPGFRANPFAYIAKSSLYVLPSYSEGFPNSLIEGMLFVPAVSVDCDTGPNEILNGIYIDEKTKGHKRVKYGYLVEQAAKREYNDEIIAEDRILADAIKGALLDKDFMAASSAERVREYSFDNHKKKIESVIEQLFY